MVHELVIAEGILRIALEEAQRTGARRILGLHLALGELEGIEPDVMQEAFELVAQDTPAAGAALVIDRVPGRIVCRACGREAALGVPLHGGTVPGRCAACGGSLRVIEGMGWTLHSIRVETGETPSPPR